MTPHHDYPGGAGAAGYRLAFGFWLVAFLGALVVSLVGYIGLRAHTALFAQ